MLIKVIKDKCTGCKLCIKACLYNAIALEENLAIIDLGKCTFCGACVEVCKFDAIILKKEEKAIGNLFSYRGVWVFAEQKKGIIQPVVYELLGKGRELADSLGEKVAAVLLGEDVAEKAEVLIKRGADKVYLVESPHLKYYQDEPYTKLLSALIREYKPEIILSR